MGLKFAVRKTTWASIEGLLTFAIIGERTEESVSVIRLSGELVIAILVAGRIDAGGQLYRIMFKLAIFLI